MKKSSISYEKGLKDSLFYFPKKALVKEIKSLGLNIDLK